MCVVQQSVAYMNAWDKSIPLLDVCDDYQSEKREVLRARGPNFPFSHGDYCVKLLLGSVDAGMDSLDEQQPQQYRGDKVMAAQPMAAAQPMRPNQSQQSAGCCIIA